MKKETLTAAQAISEMEKLARFFMAFEKLKEVLEYVSVAEDTKRSHIQAAEEAKAEHAKAVSEAAAVKAALEKEIEAAKASAAAAIAKASEDAAKAKAKAKDADAKITARETESVVKLDKLQEQAFAVQKLVDAKNAELAEIEAKIETAKATIAKLASI